MLRLRNLATRRIGTSYICSSCLVAARRTQWTGLRPGVLPKAHGRQCRALSGTSSGDVPATEATQTTATPTIAQKPQSPKKRNKKKKKPKASTATSRTKKASKKDAPKTAGKDGIVDGKAQDSGDNTLSEKSMQDAKRQLHVLESALLAARKAYGAQGGAKVDQAVKGAETTIQAKTKPSKPRKSKSKPETAKTKGPGPASKPKISATKGRMQQAREKKSWAIKPQTDSPSEGPASKPRKSAPKERMQQAREKKNWAIDPQTESPSEVPPAEVTPSPALVTSRMLPSLGINDERPVQAVERLGAIKAVARLGATKAAARLGAIKTLTQVGLHLTPIKRQQPAVPSLSYGLERVLFNSGVYQLQDPRTKVYNFDPYLAKIMPIQEFDFNALKQYVTSSKDETLISVAREHGKRYTGSTSSMTSSLAHFHYLLSSWRPVTSDMMSKAFDLPSTNFTRINRAPAATFLHWKDGVYAIDADKQYDTANILSMLGKSMEKLLTLPREDFERYRHENSEQISEEERNAEEAFHYTSFQDFMMRSQLDAHDPRIPGTGMFDLKTRAVISIRMDAKGYQKGLGYELRHRQGNWESFEREYHDMIRSAFMKYSLQVRMGRMDGIFVAFHNTQRIFGFQYISLSEMDFALHGTRDLRLGNQEFKYSLALMNDLLDRATKKFPKQSLRLHFETRESVNTPYMYVFATPVLPGQIEEVQNAGQASVESFERKVLSMKKTGDVDCSPEQDDELDAEFEDGPVSSSHSAQDAASWGEVQSMVEDAMEDDEGGVGAVREAIEDALEESGLLEARSLKNTRSYVDVLLSAVTDGRLPAKPETSYDIATSEEVEAVAEEPADTEEVETVAEEPADSEAMWTMPAQELHEEAVSHSLSEGVEVTDTVSAGLDQPHDHGTHPESDASELLHFNDQDVADSEDPLVVDSAAPELMEVDSEAMEQATEEDVSITPDEIEPTWSSEENVEQEEASEDEDVENMDDFKADVAPSANMVTLRNLILRMAQKIDERMLSQEEHKGDDSSKLEEFERILGIMVAQYKGDQNKDLTADSSSDATPALDTEGTMAGKFSTATDSEGEHSSSTSPPSPDDSIPDIVDGNLLGMVLTVRNRVNGQYVTRPDNLRFSDRWHVEYSVEDLSPARAQTLYKQCRTRRRNIMNAQHDLDRRWTTMFNGALKTKSMAGRRWRQKMNQVEKDRPVYVVGEEGHKTFEEVFGVDTVSMEDQGNSGIVYAEDENDSENGHLSVEEEGD